MPIDWKDPTVKDRLLAAIIASFDNKINCKAVATLYGEGATYNAIENFLRGPKKEAMKLKAEAGDSPAMPTPRTPRKNKADGVKAGRVTKSTPKKVSPIKKEFIFAEHESFGLGLGTSGSGSGSSMEADAEGMLDDEEYA